MPGPAQNDVATASGRKDAVRKAFNQEYLATQKAMSQAAERARAQVLDQRYTIASHAEDVKAGTKAPQPPIGHGQPNRPAQPNAHANAQPHQGAPHMASDPNLSGEQQIMFDIANEIRNIITREIDLRMQVLSEKVETALANAFPSDTATPSKDAENSKPQPAAKRGAKTTRTSRSAAKR